MKARIVSNAAPLTAMGIDIGKEIFQVVGIGADGQLGRNKPAVIRLVACSHRPPHRAGIRQKAGHSGKLGPMRCSNS